MKKIRSPMVKNIYKTVYNDGFEQIMFVLRGTSVKTHLLYESSVEFPKMKPLAGEQLSFL